MVAGTVNELDLLRALAQFRYQIRQFLQASERAAHESGLQPQQHQLLLQVSGNASGVSITIAYIAERLGLRHNSAVELVSRCVDEGLVERNPDSADGRRVLLSPTAKGLSLLRELTAFHARELGQRGSELIAALMQIKTTGLQGEGNLADTRKGKQS